MKIRLLLTITIFSLYSFLQAQIVINEFSATNLNAYPDNFAKYEDWVELYNLGDEDVNLKGYYLSDKVDKPFKWTFNKDVILESKAYLRVWCSGRDTIMSSGIHTNFKLSQTKNNEILRLTSSSEELLDQVFVDLHLLDHSFAREIDGIGSWKISVAPTPNASNINGDFYDAYTSTVEFSQESGFYQGQQQVEIITNFQDVEVYYTLNGKMPTENDLIYTPGQEITIDNTRVLKARAFSKLNNVLPGKIQFASYFIDEEFTLPVFSVAADQLQELANGNGVLRPQGSLEYFDENGNIVAKSYGELNRHGQDSWILPHRSLDWISRDEMGYSRTVEAKLFNYSERDEYQRFMFRASGDDNYPANGDFNHEGSCHIRDEYVHTLAQKGDMKMDVRALERVIVFLNGDYWGVYGLRERPADHDYTEEYYNQDKYNLHYLATWGGTWAEYGGQAAFDDWTALRDFILENNMSIEANYDYVVDRLQVRGLCDYMIINLNTVASDWLNYNTGWWRGLNPNGDHKKWGYILWDNDATFDYYINYSGVPNTDPDAVACDVEEIIEFVDDFYNGNDVGEHGLIFLKLLEESDRFRQLYYSRQADLMNTVFSCENMLTTFDSLVAIIAPEMPRQIQRWGGSMEEWMNNIDTMRQFILDRCELIDDGMVECYNITGPYPLTIDVEPAGIEDIEIEINTLDIHQFPWTGNYFGQMPNLLEAKSNDQYEFLYWKTEGGAFVSPDSTLAIGEIYIDSMETLTAVYDMIVSTESIEKENDWKVFPSVFSNQFTMIIDLNESQQILFNLYDLNGNLVETFSDKVTSYPDGRTVIHWELNENLVSGHYIVQLRSEKTVLTKKLIKLD